MLRSLFLILVMPGIMLSCSTGRLPNQNSLKLPESGLLHQKIISASDQSLTYALYIPAGFPQPSQTDAEKVRRLPCIIAFDPHGDGAFPLGRYQKLADQYGFILFGSNNAKNGLPPTEIDRIVENIYTEAKTLYPVDSARIYLMGFSGGARIASLSAFYKINVKGVVGCGAGIAGASAAPVYKPDYFGIAGMKDFNMNEIVELNYPLAQAGIRHVISTFNGIHEWPSEEVMEEPFQWFTLNAMRDGALPKDQNLVNKVMNGFSGKSATLQTRGLFIEAAETCRKAISFGEGLDSVESFRRQLAEIEKTKEYLDQMAFRKTVLESEEKERRELMDALSSKELNWWKKKISFLENEEKKKTGGQPDVFSFSQWSQREEGFRSSRLLAFLRLLCYMNATSVLTSRNEEAAEKIVAIYEISDPGNPEPFYMKAILLARKPGSKGVVEQLGIAVGKGFKDKLRMNEQPEFSSLKDTPGFYNLLQKLK